MDTLSSVPPVDIAQIAKVCHEANRAYCATLGDTSVQPWEKASQAQRDSIMQGVLFRINNPNAGPEASHEAWLRHKTDQGWKLGPLKDEAAKTHPSMVPFSQLPVSVQIKDFLFSGIVKAILNGASARPEKVTTPPTAIEAGEKNDPSVEIGVGCASCVTAQYRDTMLSLGFKESLGSFVYHAEGRAIWVNPQSPVVTEDITKQIVASAEEIGKRHKINEIRKALDIPFGEVAVVKADHERKG